MTTMGLFGEVFVAVVVLVSVLNSVSGGEISLLTKDPVITNVYLDFDKTITIDDYSVHVREEFCKARKYPDANLFFVTVRTILKRSNHT